MHIHNHRSVCLESCIRAILNHLDIHRKTVTFPLSSNVLQGLESFISSDHALRARTKRSILKLGSLFTGNGGYTNFGDPVQNGNGLSAFRNGSQGPTVMSMEMDNYNMAEPAVVLPAKHVQNGTSIQYPDAMMQMPFIGSVPQNGLEQIHSEVSSNPKRSYMCAEAFITLCPTCFILMKFGCIVLLRLDLAC